MADRYMYIPSIGLFLLVAWGVNHFLNWRPHWRRIATLGGAAVLVGCLVCTRIQLSYWQNSIQLFTHAIEGTPDNFVAYTCLGETPRPGHSEALKVAVMLSQKRWPCPQQPGGTI